MITPSNLSSNVETDLSEFAAIYRVMNVDYTKAQKVKGTVFAFFMTKPFSVLSKESNYSISGVPKNTDPITAILEHCASTISNSNPQLQTIQKSEMIFVYNSTGVVAIGTISGILPTYVRLEWVCQSTIFTEVIENTLKLTPEMPPTLYRIKGNLQYVFQEDTALIPYTSLNVPHLIYPKLGFTPTELWKAFSASNSNVLLLLGQPGTGKSSLVREMMDVRGYDDLGVYMLDNTDVIELPATVEFIRSLPRGATVIVEDADALLTKRTPGQRSAVATILNATSGMAATDTKFIFLSNLEHTNLLDNALLRRGRLFKAITFKPLSLEEANALRQHLGKSELTAAELGTEIVLADALEYYPEEHYSSGNKAKIGFI
jgi:hypothetical protein